MRRIAVIAVGLALTIPGVSLAQTPSSCAAKSAVCATSSRSTFPFTGLDLALLALGAGALLAMGVVVRRLEAGWPVESEPENQTQPAPAAQQPVGVPLSVSSVVAQR